MENGEMTPHEKRAIIEEFWKQQSREALIDAMEFNPVAMNVGKAEFVSRSNGKNRKKRARLREVTLVIYGDRVHVWKDRPTDALERVAHEILEGIVPREDIWETFYRLFTEMEPC